MNIPFNPPVTLLGRTIGRQPHRVFGILEPDRLFHTYIIGQTGTGKSTLMGSMVRQDIANGRGFGLIDPHGDLSGEVAELIGDGGIHWNLADPACPYGYNPLTYVAAEYRPLVASGLIDTLKKQWAEAWGVRMEHLLRHAILALLDRPGSTLRDIMPMFIRKAFRQEVLAFVEDPEVRCFWEHEFPTMNYRTAFDGVAPIANKLGGFLSHPLVRNALCDPAEPLRFRAIIDQGTPLVISLPKGKLGVDITNIVGGLVVSMMAQAAYTRHNIPEPDRRPYYLYLDEFHSFTTDAFAGMLSELRKYKLGLILAHQHTSQINRDTLDAILGNTGTQITFRLGPTDSALFAKGMNKAEPIDLMQLPNHRMLCKLMVKGEQSREFSAVSQISTETLI